MGVRVITEHVHFSLNPRTFVGRAIKPSGGARPIQVSFGVPAETTNLSSPTAREARPAPSAKWCKEPPLPVTAEMKPGQTEAHRTPQLCSWGTFPRCHLTKWWACQGVGQQWFKVRYNPWLVLNTFKHCLLSLGDDLQGLITHFSKLPKMRLNCFRSSCSYQSLQQGLGAELSLRDRRASQLPALLQGKNH